MRQLVDEGGASLHRPELRGDRFAIGAGYCQPQPTGAAFLLGEAAQERGRAFLGLPALRIDGLIGGPAFGIEVRFERDLDLLALAF